ncbi:MAG: glycosyltransferase family 4 protein [Myxococcota bacterium]
MKVLVLSKYGPRAASPRIRFLAYREGLAARGIRLEFSPLLDDAYLAERMTSGRISWLKVAEDYARRLRTLAGARNYDVVWLHCELFPYVPPVFETLLRRLGTPYAFDFDDAIFHGYDSSPSLLVRTLLGDKIRRVIEGAEAVTAGSAYLRDFAMQFNAQVTWVPSVVDLSDYPANRLKGDRPFTIGWLGSPSTAPALELLIRPAEELARDGPLRVHAIGGRFPQVRGVQVENRDWSEGCEPYELAEVDLGVMPLLDSPWSYGKCAFKLVQYMAAGLPTVSTPIGANLDVATVRTGFWARNSVEWTHALRQLRDAPDTRKRMGRAGRQRVEEHYCLTQTLPVVEGVLRQTAGRRVDFVPER